MAHLFFPDNTVLVNFAHINRMGLLERLANGNGTWCATVAQECAHSAQLPGLQDLADARGIFGEPLLPSASEYINVYTLRDQMAGPGEDRYKHLGEAETITIIKNRNLKAIFVTDDGGAARAARADGITVIDTWYLIKAAVKVQAITADEAWFDAQTLVANYRGHPPCARGRTAFDDWLTP